MLLRLAAILLLSTSAFASGNAYKAAVSNSCGLNSAFIAQCGNVGDPYEGNTPPASPTSVSACGTLSTLNGNFKLTQNIGSDNTATCLVLSAKGMNIDLGGFTVTGRVSATSPVDGLVLYDGTITANVTEFNADAGTIRLDWSPVSVTAALRFHHLTLTNSNSGNSRVIHADMALAPYSGSGKEIQIDHITVTSASAAAAARWAIFNVNASTGGVDASFNSMTCAADTSACQGVVCYGSLNCYLHNNYANMITYTAGNESGRAFVCDSQGASASTADNCIVENNYVIANNNRAYRNRLAYHSQFRNNIVTNVALGSTGALHVGDPDDGDQTNADVWAVNNTFSVSNGIVFWGRSVSGASAINNLVICASGGCSGGIFAAAATPAGTGTVSTLTIQNNPSVSGIGFTSENNAASGATIPHCNSGAITGAGAGTSPTITCP